MMFNTYMSPHYHTNAYVYVTTLRFILRRGCYVQDYVLVCLDCLQYIWNPFQTILATVGPATRFLRSPQPLTGTNSNCARTGPSAKAPSQSPCVSQLVDFGFKCKRKGALLVPLHLHLDFPPFLLSTKALGQCPCTATMSWVGLPKPVTSLDHAVRSPVRQSTTPLRWPIPPFI